MPEFRWTVKALENGRDIEFSGSHDLTNGVNHITCELPSCMILEVKGTFLSTVMDDERIFMNGYQTWTFSPEYTKRSVMRGVNGLSPRLINHFSLDRYGDYHFTDYSLRRGVTHGFSFCYFRRRNHYRLFASLNEEPGYTIFEYDARRSLMTVKRDCSGLKTEGTYSLFDLYVADGNEQEVFDGWFAALKIAPRTK